MCSTFIVRHLFGWKRRPASRTRYPLRIENANLALEQERGLYRKDKTGKN